MPISNFQPIRLLDKDHCYKFTYLMAYSADLDQLASEDLDLHCLQRQGISGFSRTGINILINIMHTQSSIPFFKAHVCGQTICGHTKVLFHKKDGHCYQKEQKSDAVPDLHYLREI